MNILKMKLKAVNNRFEASHNLLNYDGDCANLHGHSYRLDVEVEGAVDPSTGMVCDFKVLKKAIRAVTDQFDHKYINDIMDKNPTAENMLMRMFSDLRVEMDKMGLAHISISKMQLWETENCCAIIEVK